MVSETKANCCEMVRVFDALSATFCKGARTRAMARLRAKPILPTSSLLPTESFTVRSPSAMAFNASTALPNGTDISCSRIREVQEAKPKTTMNKRIVSRR